ncbi:hypothetical protein [Brevibacterium aurantiacum]|uniref:Integral membrane protein n=1 Tax=Brevibacterium aurantiacum TaxID=273384 RepID=A0A556CQ46_BREAU|nr:hypothetical protein [Brevibacterium aurantiacum]TSI19537.1 hypothetical protein FO013_00800 [Brevibacterium aurantiacum]
MKRGGVWPGFGGVLAALALVAAAIVFPLVTGVDVKVLSLPPLFAEFRPRVGIGSIAAVAIAVSVGVWGFRAAQRLPWRMLLMLTALVSAAWMLALDAIDGLSHLGGELESDAEYLPTARQIADEGFFSGASSLLTRYVDRIPLASAHNLPVHLAGHPPGAVLFFALLVSLGLSSTYAIGLVVTLIAATIPLAIMCTCRNLGIEARARILAPFLATAPAAIWSAVSADAVFAAVGAWAIAALSAAVAVRSRVEEGRPAVTSRVRVGWPAVGWPAVGWSVVSGLMLGLGTYMNYGFPLLGAVVLAVFAAARSIRPLPWVIGGALLVVGVFTVAGFFWWEAYPALSQRYWDGFASSRPPTYWMWANLAALICATGPGIGAGIVETARGSRRAMFSQHSNEAAHSSEADRRLRVVVLLASSAVLMVVAADLSNMSRAEVERIWLFMVPWLLVSLAAVPDRSRSWLLGLNLVFGLGLAHVAQSAW